jgi:hypothetical protein
MKLALSIFFFFTILVVFSQEKKPIAPLVVVDSLYREDQFYVGFTYNSLFNKPNEISQNKFSSGFMGGFLRDMPINKSRTVAIASGLGFSYNKCFQNILVSNTDDKLSYSPIASGVIYTKNKLDQVYVDLPIEFRWRNSTPESHKFWRIYSGFKFSYLIWNKYTHIDSQSNYQINLDSDLNKLQMGTYIAAGYNTWNFYAYYGITPFFKSSAVINNEPIKLNTLNLGLMFYIL